MDEPHGFRCESLMYIVESMKSPNALNVMKNDSCTV